MVGPNTMIPYVSRFWLPITTCLGCTAGFGQLSATSVKCGKIIDGPREVSGAGDGGEK